MVLKNIEMNFSNQLQRCFGIVILAYLHDDKFLQNSKEFIH